MAKEAEVAASRAPQPLQQQANRAFHDLRQFEQKGSKAAVAHALRERVRVDGVQLAPHALGDFDRRTACTTTHAWLL